MVDLADAQRSRAVHRFLASEFDQFLLANSLASQQLDGSIRVHETGPDGEQLKQFYRSLVAYLAVIAPESTPYDSWQATYSEIGQNLGYTLLDPADTGMRVNLFLACAGLGGSTARLAMAYFADTLFKAGSIGYDEAARATRDQIRKVAGGYRNLLFNGLPMWPQEWWINGLGVDLESEVPQFAPMRQWVFMRPSMSPVFKLDGVDDSELDAALIVEPFGFIQYQTEERDRWMGGSFMVSITNGNGIGFGGLFRYNRGIFGAAYHDDDSDVLLYATIDLYDLLFPTGQDNPRNTEFADRLSGAMLRDAVPER
jgi:hypothetical protein